MVSNASGLQSSWERWPQGKTDPMCNGHLGESHVEANWRTVSERRKELLAVFQLSAKLAYQLFWLTAFDSIPDQTHWLDCGWDLVLLVRWKHLLGSSGDYFFAGMCPTQKNQKSTSELWMLLLSIHRAAQWLSLCPSLLTAVVRVIFSILILMD